MIKLLPKKEIDRAKAMEREQFVKDGLVLAQRVDELRQVKATEEQKLKEWHENSIKVIQEDINKLSTEKNQLIIEIDNCREERKQLLKPLDKEWKELNQSKEELENKKIELFISQEQHRQNKDILEEEKKKISEIVSRITKNESETLKLKEEMASLKVLAQKEYEIAREEHISQTNIQEKKNQELNQREEEYKVALKTIEIREQQVKDKESNLITRENDLQKRLDRIISYEEKHK